MIHVISDPTIRALMNFEVSVHSTGETLTELLCANLCMQTFHWTFFCYLFLRNTVNVYDMVEETDYEKLLNEYSANHWT